MGVIPKGAFCDSHMGTLLSFSARNWNGCIQAKDSGMSSNGYLPKMATVLRKDGAVLEIVWGGGGIRLIGGTS